MYVVEAIQPSRSVVTPFEVRPKTVTPKVAVVPTSPPLGDAIVVEGRDFWPNRAVEVRLQVATEAASGSTGTTWSVYWSGEAITRSDGTFAFALPSQWVTARGGYIVEVELKGRDVLRLEFTVGG